LCVVLASGLFLSATASQALAAAPGPQPDSVTASPTGTLDVLANDSDPDGDALTVVATTQPARGSVTCSALGACLYTSASREPGTDSFTYTVRDAQGEEAAATVTVTIEASSTAGVLNARDDDVATAAGAPITIPVLANDAGTGLTVTNHSAPQQGAVTCDATSCKYEPAAGPRRTDGFTYTVRDANERSATAQVHVLVAPTGAGYTLSAGSSSPDPVAAGAAVTWSVGAQPTPDEISGQELAALALPSGTLALTGDHALAPDGLKAARGWTAKQSGGGVRFAATSDAVLGEALTQAFPKPLPPISQGTGGDGHVPILVGSKVFAFYHHSNPTSVTCVDRATGQLCPGYPKRLGLATTDINGPGVVDGTRIYTHLLPRGSYAQSAPIALFCWDAATDATCGLTIVDRVARTSNPGASAPVLAAGKMWFGGDTGKLYCVDPATGRPCVPASLNTGLGDANETYYDAVSHGSRVFLARRAGRVACVDVVAGGPCPGWETPLSFEGAWNVVNRHDATGATTGVCVFTARSGSCLSDADPSTRTPVTNFVNVDPYSQGYSHALEAETGTRTLVGSLSRSGLGCYDWSTMAPCTGGGYDSEGWLQVDRNGARLPSAYGAAFDGACAIGLGDPGQVFTVDPAGTSPCLSLRSGASRTKVDLREQRADGTVGKATWGKVVLSDVAQGEMESVVVTIRDAGTEQVLKTGDLVNSNPLDLSGIDAHEHPAITVDATARSTQGTDLDNNKARSAAAASPWDDAIPPRLTVTWNSDPQLIEAVTTASTACSATGPLRFEAELSAPSVQRTPFVERALTPTACTAVLTTPAAPKPASTPRKPVHRPKCKSKRVFPIHVRFKGKDALKVTVTIDRKKQRVLRVRPRPVIRINLTGLGKRTVTVKIVIKAKDGRTVTRQRVYHTCAKKRLPTK
jgi:outer membrane protein assembly factor BamB